jgi:hypothetical protein
MDVPRCGTCGLVQVGPEADELRAALAHADTLLERQRILSFVPVAAEPAPPSPGAPAAAATDVATKVAATAHRRGLPEVSIPFVLLGLGTLCVLVAAVVFVAVTWSDLSLAWRTAVLLGVTALGIAAAAWGLRRGLRGPAEALTLVASGLLCIDLLAGSGAGLPLLSLLEGTALGWFVAVVMAATGLGWVVGAQRTRTGSLVGEQVVVVLALAAMVWLAAVGWDFGLEWLGACVAVAAALFVVPTWLLRAHVVAFASAVLAVLGWAYLALAGLKRAMLTESSGELFLELGGAPLVVASLMAGLVTMLGRFPAAVRGVTAGFAVGGPVVVLLLPVRDLGPTAGLLLLAGASALLAAAALAARHPWSPALRAVAGLTAVVPVLALGGAVLVALDRVLSSPAIAWTRDLSDPLADPAFSLDPALWVYPFVGALVAPVAAVALRGHARDARGSAAVGLIVGALTALLLAPGPLWVPGACLIVVCAVLVVLLVRGGSTAWVPPYAALTVVALLVATPSAAATAAFFLAHGALLAVVAWRVGGIRRLLLVASALAVGAVSLEASARLAGLQTAVTGLLLLGAAAAAAVLAQRLRDLDGGVFWRLGLEPVAAGMAAAALLQTSEDGRFLTVALAVVAVVSGYVAAVSPDRRLLACAGVVALAGTAHQGIALTGAAPEWGAVAATAVAGAAAVVGQLLRSYRHLLEPSALVVGMLALPAQAEHLLALTVGLTVAGVCAVLVSFGSADRRWAAWLGGVLLLAASWVRLYELRVEVVEAYTLPGATALLVTGLLWMRRSETATTWQALGAGLTLGLVPSLAVALSQPTSLRALFVGVVSLALVLAGTRLRWGAPLLVGGVSVAALTVVNVAPYAAALPRWVLFGAAGVTLLVLGVTWEQRRQELQLVHRYATRLR